MTIDELIDALEALEKVVGGVVIGLGSTRFMDPPDGGAPSLGEQVERMRLALEAAEAREATKRHALLAIQLAAAAGLEKLTDEESPTYKMLCALHRCAAMALQDDGHHDDCAAIVETAP